MRRRAVIDSATRGRVIVDGAIDGVDDARSPVVAVLDAAGHAVEDCRRRQPPLGVVPTEGTAHEPGVADGFRPDCGAVSMVRQADHEPGSE